MIINEVEMVLKGLSHIPDPMKSIVKFVFSTT